jgi:hypothetical protein
MTAIYGAGLLYQVTETATVTNTLTYHYDYRGSTIALSTDNGNVTDRIEYSLYGLTTYRVGTNDTPLPEAFSLATPGSLSVMAATVPAMSVQNVAVLRTF